MTRDAAPSDADGTGAPVIRVLRGVPTDEELAALVGVLLSRGGAPAGATPVERPLWRGRQAQLRAPLTAGPGAWRASGLPR
jgi:hypothetical protein